MSGIFAIIVMVLLIMGIIWITSDHSPAYFPAHPGRGYPDYTGTATAAVLYANQLGTTLIGITKIAAGYVVTLHSVDRQHSFNSSRPDRVAPGNVLVALDISIASQQGTGVNVDPLYCILLDSNGTRYTPRPFGEIPALGSQNDLPAGQELRGWVTFEVPENATGFSFVYLTPDGPSFWSRL